MPAQAQSNPVAVSLKLLVFSMLIVTDSKALPIPQKIGVRGTGITSPDEDFMSIKVGSSDCCPHNPSKWTDKLGHNLERLGMAVCRCGSDRRLFRLRMEVRSDFSVHEHLGTLTLIHRRRVCRMRFLRVRNRPLRDFFTFIEAPQQRGDVPSPWSTRPNPQTREGLTPVPFNQRRRGITRATDIDSEGRRQGGPDPDDANADITEKDVLPAYEVKGGPPNYGQFSRSQLAETSSGVTNPSTQLNPASGVHLSLPLPPSYSPETVTTRPITPSANP